MLSHKDIFPNHPDDQPFSKEQLRVLKDNNIVFSDDSYKTQCLGPDPNYGPHNTPTGYLYDEEFNDDHYGVEVLDMHYQQCIDYWHYKEFSISYTEHQKQFEK